MILGRKKLNFVVLEVCHCCCSRVVIIIIIIIKTSSTGPIGKNKIVHKLLTQPHKHLRHGKTKKQLREATND